VETKRLIEDHPDNVDGLYNLGAFYANRSRIGLARETWTEAAALAPASESGQKAREGLAKLGPWEPGIHSTRDATIAVGAASHFPAFEAIPRLRINGAPPCPRR
jgi:hypothetical protein